MARNGLWHEKSRRVFSGSTPFRFSEPIHALERLLRATSNSDRSNFQFIRPATRTAVREAIVCPCFSGYVPAPARQVRLSGIGLSAGAYQGQGDAGLSAAIPSWAKAWA